MVPYATPVLRFNFNNGTNGVKVDIADTPSAGDDAFAAVTENTASGGHFKYSSTVAAHGPLSLKIATGATSTSCYCSWNTSGTNLALYSRYYIYIPTGTTFGSRWDHWQPRDSSTRIRHALNTSRQLQAINGSTVVGTATSALPFDTWIRVEGKLVISATVGIIEIKYFTGDSETATETITATGLNTGTTEITNVRMGNPFPTANVGPVYFDDLALSYTGYMGPSVLASTLGLVTGAGSPLAVARRKTRTLGVVTESGTLHPVGIAGTGGGAPQEVDLGLAAESGTPVALARTKARTLGLIVETSTPHPVARTKARATGQVTEVSTLHTAARTKARTFGLTTETGTAAAAGRSKTWTTGLVTETGAAQTVARARGATVGPITETGTPAPIAREKTRTLGIPAETAAVQALARAKARALGEATETCTPVPASRAKARAFGLVGETSTALPLDTGTTTTIGLATETSTTHQVGRVKARTLGVIVETSTAQPVRRQHARALPVIPETSALLTVARAHTRALGGIPETGTVVVVGLAHLRRLGLITEVGTCRPLGLPPSGADLEYEVGRIITRWELGGITTEALALGDVTDLWTLGGIQT